MEDDDAIINSASSSDSSEDLHARGTGPAFEIALDFAYWHRLALHMIAGLCRHLALCAHLPSLP